MFKRTCWLLVAVLFPLVLLGGIGEVEGMARSSRGETAVTPVFVINEIHADPDGSNGDANGDGEISSSQDEFIELINQSGELIDIGGWKIYDEVGERHIFPDNTLVPDGCAIVVFGGGVPIGDFGGGIVQTSYLGLNNGGDTVSLKLSDGKTAVVSYTFGSEGGENQSLTRDPDITGLEPLVKHSTVSNANGVLFSPGTHTDGSPFASCQPPAYADIKLEKTSPSFVQAGELFTYSITLENIGSAAAADVIVTDTLPIGMAYVGDNSGVSPIQPDPQTIVWQLGGVPAQDAQVFKLTVLVDVEANGWLTNTITATISSEEFAIGDNVAKASTYVGSDAILIEAVYYDGYGGVSDEAVSLINVSNQTVDVGGWRLSDGGTTAVIPPSFSISPGEIVWLTNDAAAFKRQFGHVPDAAITLGGTGVSLLTGLWPGFANDGDEVLLSNPAAQMVDVLVYERGNTSQAGWTGTAVQPFTVAGQEGQILYRQRSQTTSQIVPDTNTAADWAQSRDNVINGRKVRYPGWDLDEFFFTAQITETAVLTIAIAPDNAYEAISQQILSANTTIQAEIHSFENTAISDALVQAATRGVSVTLLLEGDPVGGVTDQEHYLCKELMTAGGLCAFMINDSVTNIFDRYDYLHAKFMLIDGERVIISSQNLSPSSLPHDDKSDGTWGRRGVVLITDAPQVVVHVQTLFVRDYDFAHGDILTGTGHLDPLPIGFVPITQTGGTTYTVRYPQPAAFSGVFPFEIIQSPENSLRDVDGLLGLVNRAGAGDVVLVQQLYERPFWGASSSNPIDDPNPRLEAYINAARRGARVRLLLDEYFDIAEVKNSNAVTCAYIDQIAKQEHLRLECAVANPTGLGIHNKMVLVQINGVGYIHVGSINGSEASSKVNRELALQVQSNEAYTYLATMFDHDWPYRVYLPAILNNVYGSADHILISEIQYNPPGEDSKEFVELVNPTSMPVDMSAFSLGDAVAREDFADVRRFPAGTILLPHETLVVAHSAAPFFAEHHTYPDFEIWETVTAVPNLIDDPTWGDPGSTFQLGNSGDNIILRNTADQVVDILSYGEASYPGIIPCPLVTTFGAVLERFPYWQDTDDCAIDFREWPFPSPGNVPN